MIGEALILGACVALAGYYIGSAVVHLAQTLENIHQDLTISEAQKDK
jgi:hypothetical protein